jgi:hypothetical protein
MTVKELIDMLSDLPEDLEVFILNENDGTELTPDAIWVGCDNENEELELYEEVAENMRADNPGMSDEELEEELCPVAIISVS